MAGTGGSGTDTRLVAGGILALFFVFLLFLLVPAHLLILPIIIGAGILMLVTVFLIRHSGPVTEVGPVPDPRPPDPGEADTPAGITDSPADRRSPVRSWLAVLAALWFTLSFFWYEIQPRMNNNTPVPLTFIVFQLILVLLLCSMVWRCRNLPPVMDGLRQASGRTGTALNAIIRVIWQEFGVYIAAAIVLNGGLAVILLAAADRILSISFTGANGFMAFLYFAFGNLLIFALVLVRMEQVWEKPAGSDVDGPADPRDMPPAAPDPAVRYTIMTILALVFTALFFAVPMLAFSTGIIGPEAHDREILLVVERADPALVTVMLAGGKDAGTLVALDAAEYEKIEPSFFDRKRSTRRFINDMQVGPKTGTVPLPNGTRFNLTGLCNSTCIVTVDGYFSDGKQQRFYDAVV